MKRTLRMLCKEYSCKTLVKMKLIVIILVVAAGLQVNANGYAQNTVTLSERNSTLLKVFKQIKRQTGYSYLLTSDLLDRASKVNIEVTNVSLKDALDMIFREQPLVYSIIGKTIVVKEREEPKKVTVVEGSPINGLPIDVRGRVVNEKGEPVEGVTVSVKGSKKFTITNANGEFSLATVDPEAVLVFTSVNMETFEVKVDGRVDVAINLKTKVTALGDVTVTGNTGYQTVKPNEITGSIGIITKQQLDQRVAPDVISKLEGITNGLVFNKNPNSGANELRVRGESTLFGYTEPLIVVDNFPYDGDINEINPNDVESVTILKDAAAASIWGVRAGNGVIVITTRKPKINQPLRLEFNANTTIANEPDLFYPQLMSPSDFIDLETLLFSKGRYNTDLADLNLKAVSPVVEILNNRKLGRISASDSAAQINALRGNDWRNELLNHVYRNAITQQYQVNVNAGGNKSSHYFSVGYDKNLATVIGNESNRITLNSQSVFRPLRNFNMQIGVNYVEGKAINNGIENIPNLYPYSQLINNAGMELPVRQHRATFEDTITNRGFLDWRYFPLQERNNQNNTVKGATTRVTTALSYTIIGGLNVEFSYQYYKSAVTEKNLLRESSYTIRDNINKFAIISNGRSVGSNYPAGGNLALKNTDIVAHNGRFKIGYNHRWNNHAVSSIAGVEVREVRTESNGYRLLGFNEKTGTFAAPNTFTSYPTYPSGNANLGGSGAYSFGYSGNLDRFRSYFGNVSYTYGNRYTLFGSIRFDGSNYFGVKTNNKTVPLWSVGGKWDLLNERFIKLNTFSDLNLRVTYGYNGNVSPDLAAITTIRYGPAVAPFTGLPYAYIENVPNPELRWEKLGQLNLGVYFTLKNNRISGSIEYYRKKGKDLIGSAPIDPTTGISQIRGNFSDIKSKGVDIQLITNNLTGQLKWMTSIIFNYSEEIVTRYDVEAASRSYLGAFKNSVTPLVGYPVRALFSYRWGGLDPATGDPRVILQDTINKSYASTTLSKITTNDLMYNGRYNPPFAGGIMNRLSWKGISLAVNMVYKFGHYFRRNSIAYYPLQTLSDGWKSAHSDYSARWQNPGDEAITNVPSFLYPISSSARDEFYTNSSVLVEKADHLRLQFVNLDYSFSGSILKKLRLQNLDVYFYANNLGVIWRANDKGIDPDYPYLNYPPAKTYSFGLKAGF